MVLLFLLWLLLGGALWFFLRRRLRLGSWLFLRMLLFLAIHPLLILLLRIWLPVWFRWRLLPLHLRWLLRLRPLLFLTLLRLLFLLLLYLFFLLFLLFLLPFHVRLRICILSRIFRPRHRLPRIRRLRLRVSRRIGRPVWLFGSGHTLGRRIVRSCCFC